MRRLFTLLLVLTAISSTAQMKCGVPIYIHKDSLKLYDIGLAYFDLEDTTTMKNLDLFTKAYWIMIPYNLRNGKTVPSAYLCLNCCDIYTARRYPLPDRNKPGMIKTGRYMISLNYNERMDDQDLFIDITRMDEILGELDISPKYPTTQQ